jgi:hypothetical protein
VRFLDWCRSFFRPEELAAVLAATPLCFDLSVFEMFAPLCAGGAVIAVESIFDTHAAESATLVNTVPSAIQEMLRTGRLPPGLRTANLAGEVLAWDTVQALFNAGLSRVLNLYGPTEATTYSTCAELASGQDTPPIGRAIDGTQTHLLDTLLRPVASEFTGEIAIGGEGVARGYWNQPALTAECFLPDPFGGQPGARLYRTGDLGRRLADGQLEFLGRLDEQVKLRGYRIELAEVEAALRSHPAVREAAAAVQGVNPAQLVAYVVSAALDGCREEDLHRHLAALLPAYMLPENYVFLEALPRTTSGKVDRCHLPAPDVRTALETDPATPEEDHLLAVWRQLLGTDAPGASLPLFTMGANSLQVLQASILLSERLGRPVPAVDFFRYPTIRKLAEHLRRGNGSSSQPARPEPVHRLRGMAAASNVLASARRPTHE